MTELTTRHRRTPSKPLRVRTVSASHPSNSPPLDTDNERFTTTLLSPSFAELPSALPSAAPSAIPDASRRRSSIHEKAKDVQGLAPIVPATSSSEKYGFVVYVGSLVAWYIYLIWGFVPDRYLQRIGIQWYPSREWAILIPSWMMIAVVFVYAGYFCLNLYNTPALDDLCSITDSQTNILPRNRKNSSGKLLHTVVRYGKDGQEENYIPPLYDLPPCMINVAVFGREGRIR